MLQFAEEDRFSNKTCFWKRKRHSWLCPVCITLSILRPQNDGAWLKTGHAPGHARKDRIDEQLCYEAAEHVHCEFPDYSQKLVLRHPVHLRDERHKELFYKHFSSSMGMYRTLMKSGNSVIKFHISSNCATYLHSLLKKHVLWEFLKKCFFAQITLTRI